MSGLNHQLAVISRISAALFGGYALSYFAAGALAVVLPAARSEAAVIAMLIGLLIYAAAIMWVFSARSALRAWLVLGVITLVCVAITHFGVSV